MKTRTGTASAVAEAASIRPVTRRKARKSEASTAQEATAPDSTRVAKLDPNTRKKRA